MTQTMARTNDEAGKLAAFIKAQDAKGISSKVSMAEF